MGCMTSFGVRFFVGRSVRDIIISIDIILENITPTSAQLEAGDINNSGTIDIVIIVGEIIGE